MGVYKYDKANDKMDLIAGGTLYADVAIGAIIPYGGTTAPDGFLLCQGQAVSRTTYAELFAIIGTAYGSGNGSTTFNIPDLREATTKGAGLSGKSNTHYDTNGLAVGEFIEDRNKNHYHNVYVRDTGHSHTVDAVSAQNAGVSVSLAQCAINITPSTMYPTTSTGSARANVEVNGSAVFSSLKQNQTAESGSATTEVKAVGVNYIIKAKHTSVPVDFIDAMNEKYKALPYELNRSSNVSAFNRKWLVTGNSIVWTATHTGRLTIRCLKHGDGYSLYLTNQNSVMLDSYDNFFGDETHGLVVSEASITLQAWVRKGDVIELSTNLPANTDWADKYFVQTGLLLYNDNFD